MCHSLTPPVFFKIIIGSWVECVLPTLLFWIKILSNSLNKPFFNIIGRKPFFYTFEILLTLMIIRILSYFFLGEVYIGSAIIIIVN